VGDIPLEGNREVVGKLKVKLLSACHSILTLSFPEIESVKNSENYFLAVTDLLRQKIIANFQSVFPKRFDGAVIGNCVWF
jgi:hypothetical protein